MRTQFVLFTFWVFFGCFIDGAVSEPCSPSAEEDAALIVAAGLSTFRRALSNSPTGGYTPGRVDCPPNRPVIRSASALSPNETSWLQIRRNKTVSAMTSLLIRANIPGFDASSYISGVANNASALPNIGIAISGGGYRALMNGAGFVAAADNRTTNSTGPGQIGGLLQATTYLAGLSGGSWLVGSLYLNNFSTVVQLRDGSSGSSVWQFGNSIFQGPASDGLSIANTADYFSSIVSDVKGKSDADFATSITDYWGRALSYQLINATNGGPGYTFSSVSLDQSFVNGDTPFPCLVTDSRMPGTTAVSLNSTVYEVNPFELGSWDPTTFAFVPLEYLGSNFSAGTIPAGLQCVRGLDNAGYIMGTSSTLFNQFLLYYNTSSLPSIIGTILTNIAQTIGADDDDIAQYSPNPFFHYNNDTNQQAQSRFLTLVDGGEDLQNLPLNPLIQPNRGVDVIFAVDSSADTNYGWPNGTSLVATYQRSLNATIENGTAFPSIPDQNTFVNLGLNSHPTFFGCDASNATGLSPVIVYIPNGPYITQSNVSTFDDSYNNTQRNLIIENGYNAATLGNGTIDSQWTICVACAILSRSFFKTGTSVPSACTTCFSRYCWNGTMNSTTPSGNYTPEYILGEVIMASSSNVALVGATYTSLLMAVAVGAYHLL